MDGDRVIEVDNLIDVDLYNAVDVNDFPRVQWLIQEGGANVNAEITWWDGVDILSGTLHRSREPLLSAALVLGLRPSCG
jgi:hypothetical protein